MNITAKNFGYLFGAIYLAVGLVGFALTGMTGVTATEGPHLLFFEINPLHNVVHLLVGVGLLGGAAAGEHVARIVTLLIGSVYALVGVLGLFLVGSAANILALNHADNLLHLGTAAVAFLVLAIARRPVPVTQ